MAKVITLKGANEVFDGTIAGTTFNPALTNSVQVGDVFYVPKQNLVILGNALEDRNPATGATRTDEEGNVKYRSVGQHFPVVHIIDGKPQSVVELYLGQIIKVDAARRLVYPDNSLAKAYRSKNPDKELKDLMCGKYLTVKEEGSCLDRVWQNADPATGTSAGWKRDENGKLVTEQKRCYRFEVEIPGTLDKEACEDMIADYMKENYESLLSPVQE